MSMILTARALQIKTGNPLRKLVLVKLADNANDQGNHGRLCRTLLSSVKYLNAQCRTTSMPW
ncbi:hypothetical protein [Morganella morganii]|uniref:hypothetical protein n=1 Tax=Morganella morganii TaxID=582 RepID=UPI00351CF525